MAWLFKQVYYFELTSQRPKSLLTLFLALRLLGKWEEAHTDFCAAQKNDFDEDVAQWIKEVTPNVTLNLDYRALCWF